MNTLKKKIPGPNVYIIAGPNGAGKTTFARKFLPQYVRCLEFVNANLIVGGLSPFGTEKAAIHAGRLMLEEVHSLGKTKGTSCRACLAAWKEGSQARTE